MIVAYSTSTSVQKCSGNPAYMVDYVAEQITNVKLSMPLHVM